VVDKQQIKRKLTAKFEFVDRYFMYNINQRRSLMKFIHDSSIADSKFLSVAQKVLLFLAFWIGFQCTPAHARLSNNEVTKQTSISEQNDRLSLSVTPKRQKSNECVRRGISVHTTNPTLALYWYGKAIELDQNPYGYMGVAFLAGHTVEGITLMEIAKEIFYREGDFKGFQLADEWLGQESSDDSSEP
jgi:hypothetical protein